MRRKAAPTVAAILGVAYVHDDAPEAGRSCERMSLFALS
jgi:hypothetical protein